MNSFRPWWAHFGQFYKKETPVDVPRTVALFAAIAAAGALLLTVGLGETEPPAIVLVDRPREGLAIC